MKKILIIFIYMILVGCSNKEVISLEQYRGLQDVVEFEKYFFETQPPAADSDEVTFVNELIEYINGYKDVYKSLNEIDIDSLDKDAKELHIIYTNLSYNEIQYKTLLANTSIDLKTNKGENTSDSSFEEIDKYRDASEEYLGKLDAFYDEHY